MSTIHSHRSPVRGDNDHDVYKISPAENSAGVFLCYNARYMTGPLTQAGRSCMFEKIHRNVANKRLGRAVVLALLVAAVNVAMPACGKGEKLTLTGTVSESGQETEEHVFAQETGTAASMTATDSDMSAASETVDPADGTGKTQEQEHAAAETDDSEPASNVVVYLCGAVEHAGVYELPEGSRVVDAIRMAGGLTLMADETCVNQARILADGEQIYIWTMEERNAYRRGENVTAPETSAGAASAQAAGSAESGLVNLNTASQEELTTLPGIGDAKAAAIIAYRQEHGGFSAREELKNVSGIGDATYEKLKDRIET